MEKNDQADRMAMHMWIGNHAGEQHANWTIREGAWWNALFLQAFVPRITAWSKTQRPHGSHRGFFLQGTTELSCSWEQGESLSFRCTVLGFGFGFERVWGY